MKRSFDNIARPYQRLEYFVFGDLLERVRKRHITSIRPQSQTALLLGDGDGRFAQSLLQRLPHLVIHSIDSSRTMLEIAQQRLQNNPRFKPIHADALTHSYPHNQYDLIALNFIVDCFTQAQFESLKPKLHNALKPKGQLLYSDFAYTKSYYNKVLIQALYLLFFAAADLKTRKLPQTNWRTHFKATRTKTWLHGTLSSALFERNQ